jgi:hypothetical protein
MTRLRAASTGGWIALVRVVTQITRATCCVLIAGDAHLGPFSRRVIAAIDSRLAALDEQALTPTVTADITMTANQA